MILGLIAGGWLRTPSTPWVKIRNFAALGLALLAGGMLLDATGVCPSVKRIWTPAWVLFSGGWCFLLMAVFHLLADLLRARWLFFPFVIFGLNSIAIYVLVHTVAGFFGKALRTHFGDAPFRAAGDAFEPLVHGAAVLAILWLILLWMHRRKLYLRL